MAHEHVDRVEKRHILAHDGVTMVGEAEENGQRVLVISVHPGSGLGPDDFPGQVQGLPVFVEEREAPDPIAAVPRGVTHHDVASHRSIVRPTQPGTSIGPIDVIGAGTLSFLMEDGSGTRYISGNEHVFTAGGVPVGNEIIQPGVSDISVTEPGNWVIGSYDDRVEPHDGMTVDMAWGEAAGNVGHSNTVHGVGQVQGVRSPEPGDAIVKSGRSSGVTAGTVDQVGVSIDVSSSGLTLDDQILSTDTVSDPGDSGSPVLHDDGSNDAVGVVWGGNSSITAMCDAENWESVSGLSIVTVGGDGEPAASFDVSADGLVIDVDAGASSDPDGSIVSYEWNVDGATATGQTATFEFDAPGTYWVNLTVTDDEGETDSASESVAVAAMDCSYNGADRAEYTYTGESIDTYERWRDCEITTSQFQNRTPPGDGTAALVAPGPCVGVTCGEGEVCEGGTCVPEPTDGPNPLVIAAGIGLAIYLLS